MPQHDLYEPWGCGRPTWREQQEEIHVGKKLRAGCLWLLLILCAVPVIWHLAFALWRIAR